MSPLTSSSTPWASALEDAACAFHGGPRSFPPSCDRDVAAQHGYQPPNRDYEQLFISTVRLSQPSSRSAVPHSAGWLLPDALSVCRPVLVAHSILAAIWLIRETLPNDALPASAWRQLVSAAQDRAGDVPGPSSMSPSIAHLPPSAQKQHTPPPPTTKRAAPSAAETASPPAHKRPRRSAATPDASQLSALAATPLLTAPAAPPEPVVTSVTNHNRRAELTRAKKQEQAREKAKVACGLVAPPPGASRRERSAYESIEPEDEAHVSWLLRQPVKGDTDLFSSTQTPYVKASAMLEKAQSIGNLSSRASAAAFLRSWRAQGTPFAQESSDTHRPMGATAANRRLGLTQPGPQPQPQPSTASTIPATTLASAWSLCDRYEQELDIMHIRYRWAMAFLGKVYTEKMSQIRLQDSSIPGGSKNRHGRGKVSSEAMDAIMISISATPDAQQRQRFKRRLHQALRWYSAASELGWGMLCLMPHDVVTNSWVENDVLVGQWHIWLQLVRRVNADACEASRALEDWLGSEGLAGGSIREKETLYIEEEGAQTSVQTAATQVTEVEDSEDEDTSSKHSQGAEGQDRSSCAGQSTVAQRRALRQLTLVELIQPSKQQGC